MIDELYDLILGEKGFVVKVRCNYCFDTAIYKKIRNLINVLVIEWKKTSCVPKKAMLALIELMICLVGDNRFLDNSEKEKLEDASIEINCLLNSLYETI